MKRIPHVAELGLLAVLLSGCAGLAGGEAPPAAAETLPSQWQAPLPHQGRVSDLRTWWSQFDDPLLTHLSLIGSLLFFFATAPLRQRLIATGRLRAKAPDAAEYVKHMQDLLVDGLGALRRSRRGRTVMRAS